MATPKASKAAVDQQSQAGPPPFFYTGTDNLQPADGGAPGYSMTPDNLAPALVVWLFLTTNPTWPHVIAGGLGIPSTSEAGVLTVADIASQLGLTQGCVQTIFDLATKGPNANDVMSALNLVGRTFQSIKALDTSVDAYKPICPPFAESVLKLSPSALVQNQGAPAGNPSP